MQTQHRSAECCHATLKAKKETEIVGALVEYIPPQVCSIENTSVFELQIQLHGKHSSTMVEDHKVKVVW